MGRPNQAPEFSARTGPICSDHLQIAEASQLMCVNVRETGLGSREGFAQLCVRVGEGLFFDPWWYYMEGEETRRYNMDFFELVKIIFARVQKLEPDNVVKIIGCILLKEPSEQEMVQLAFSSDGMLLSEISHAKNMLGLLSPKNSMLDMQASSYPPSGSRSTSSSVNFHIQTQQWDPQPAPEHHQRHNFDYVPWQYPDSVRDNYSLNKQPQPGEEVDATNLSSNYYYPEAAFTGDVSSRLTRRSQSLSDLPIKVCHYFNKGYCKHGLNCRFSHAQSFPDGYSHVFSPIMNNSANEEHSHTSKSLEKLDMEIAQLLRSKRGMPVSIASLPMLYSDKYGKCLQAEGYLTESQRHGKAGYNLTRLLSHLKNIRLIERPHGQHSVILAEDSPRYIECRNDRNSLSLTVSSSHQIYLTFPAESTFTEDDVSNYFKQYGQVRDVRIPCQDKRMFGFVSFVHPQTVNKILMKRNPHYICGARVLVKPYREKSKVMDRTYSETFKPMSDCHSQYPGMDRDAHSGENNSNFYKYVLQEPEFSRLFRYQMIEETMDHEIFCLSEMNLAPKSPTGQELVPRGTKDPNDLSLDQISYEFDLLNDGSTAEDKARSISNPFIDDESGHIELPESLFESPPITSIFALV